MLKLAVAFAFSIVLFAPTYSIAAEKFDTTDPSEAAQFLQGRTNSLYGVDPPRYLLNQAKTNSLYSPFSEFSPVNRIERGISQKGLIPIKFNNSDDAGCNGTSVEDFLKGKCNKLHGFDVRPYERGKGKLPPAWGGDEFTGGGSFIKESEGKGWHIYGDEGTKTISPFFEQNIYQRVPSNVGIPQKEKPLLGPSEQKLQDTNPLTK